MNLRVTGQENGNSSGHPLQERCANSGFEHRLTERQQGLLRVLVRQALVEGFNATEPFLAVRVGLAGITIHHPHIEPIQSAEMADLDQLALLGLLDLHRLHSGARSFSISASGFRAFHDSFGIEGVGSDPAH